MFCDNALRGARGVRCVNSAELRDFLRQAYHLDAESGFEDLGGSCNLNLAVRLGGAPCVARVYRPWVTPLRLEETNRVLRLLAPELPVPEKLPTPDGRPFLSWQGRLVELERFVPHDGRMNTPQTLLTAVHLLARLHARLEGVPCSPDTAATAFANYLSQEDCLEAVGQGAARMRSWSSLTPLESRMAGLAEELAGRLQEVRFSLPRQLTHGDFWDNNVLFRGGEVACVNDYDFLGLRPRADDLALTLYFTEAQLCLFDPFAGDRFTFYRRLFKRYAQALDTPWSQEECFAMPYIMARQPLWGIGRWCRILDDEASARASVQDMEWYLKWGLSMLDAAPEWSEKVFAPL